MKFNKTSLLFILAILICCPGFAYSIPAFPGAEGFGANTIGGRGGKVIKVTNLNDSGTGSLRAAVSTSGPRIVVFEVSGIINLKSNLLITQPYITVAGQTSPGGILVTGRTVRVNTHDVIIQHMRFRVGSHAVKDGANPESLDSFNIWGQYWGSNDAYNIMIDHSSFSWGVDETFSITGGVTDTTVQWSIVSEGLSQAGHPKGEHSKGLLVSGKYQYPNTVSLHHNYIAQNTSRNPELYSPVGVDTTVDVVNNVIYNWKGGLSPSGGGSTKQNWIHNYAKQGARSNDYSFEVRYSASGMATTPLLYVEGNIGSTRLSQSEPDWNVGTSWTNTPLPKDWQKSKPWPAPKVSRAEMSLKVANCILSAVGATAPIRDSVDSRVINDFSAGTGDIINNVSFPGDFPTFSAKTPPADKDNDGMADSWELKQGLNTSANDSAQDKDGNGYTNIEEYLHHLSSQSYTYNTACMPLPKPFIKKLKTR